MIETKEGSRKEEGDGLLRWLVPRVLLWFVHGLVLLQRGDASRCDT